MGFCLIDELEDNFWCGKMGVGYPEYHATLGSISEFMRRLLGPDTRVWVQVGADGWLKLADIAVLYRNSKYGFSSEAGREPEVGDFAVDFFHICRVQPCGFWGDRNGRNKVKDRAPLHISEIAYSGDDHSVPVGDARGAAGVPPFDGITQRYWKASVGPVELVSVLLSGAKSELSEMSLVGFLTDCSRRLSTFLFDNVLLFVLIIAKGFFDGFSQSLWGGHPWRFVVTNRVLIY